METPIDPLTVINTAVGLMSLVLGGFAIWLSLNFYTKAKDAETETAKNLEAIRAQWEAIQRLTGKWMDRFTRHATEPKPADQGLLQLVHVVASLPTALLTHLNSAQSTGRPDPSPQLVREVVDCYVGLYYYTALANVLAQLQLPLEAEFDPQNELHTGVQGLVDRTASDFALMGKAIAGLDQSLVANSSLKQLLEEALTRWRPHVRFTSQVFESQRGAGAA